MMYVKKYEFIVFELRGFAMQIYYDIICWIPRWYDIIFTQLSFHLLIILY